MVVSCKRRFGGSAVSLKTPRAPNTSSENARLLRRVIAQIALLRNARHTVHCRTQPALDPYTRRASFPNDSDSGSASPWLTRHALCLGPDQSRPRQPAASLDTAANFGPIPLGFGRARAPVTRSIAVQTGRDDVGRAIATAFAPGNDVFGGAAQKPGTR